MSSRVTAILIVLACAAQLLAGGVAGPVSVCVGGAHHEAGSAVEGGVFEPGCGHDSDLRRAVPIETPGCGCGCADVVLSGSDQLVGMRFDAGALLAFGSAVVDVRSEPWLMAARARRGPPGEVLAGVATAGRLASVRSTRLLL